MIRRHAFAISTLAIWAGLPSAAASAQIAGPLAYGISERFAAAQQLVIFGVQQAISDLPPTSGQSFTYEYDTALDSYVRSDRPGPTSFLAPETIGAGTFDVHVGLSYFELSRSFRPIDYDVRQGNQFLGYTKIGASVSADVGVTTIAATYGILPDLDFALTIPITVVHANATNSFTTCKPDAAALCGTAPNPPVLDAGVVYLTNRERLDDPAFLRGEDPRLYQRSGSATEFSSPGRAVPFDEGTHVGLGRVTLALKKAFQPIARVRAALFSQVALPSPSEDEFAGSDSAGLMARVVTATDVTDSMRVLADAGYEYDTEFRELSRFVWDVGASYSIARATFDAGVGGSLYDEPIEWTPRSVGAFDPELGSFALSALEDNELGTNYVAVRAGVRVRISESSSLSATVAIPVTDDTFRPDATGTLAVDVSF